MKTFNKSTPEKIEQIKVLYKQGLSFSDIAQKVKLDRSTCYYWLNKNFAQQIKEKKQEKILQEKLKEIEQAEEKELLRIRDAAIERAEKEKKRLLKEKLKNRCKSCGKVKSKKWRLTKFCCMECWDLKYKPVINLYSKLPKSY